MEEPDNRTTIEVDLGNISLAVDEIMVTIIARREISHRIDGRLVFSESGDKVSRLQLDCYLSRHFRFLKNNRPIACPRLLLGMIWELAPQLMKQHGMGIEMSQWR
jgi:hypothetical protein